MQPAGQSGSDELRPGQRISARTKKEARKALKSLRIQINEFAETLAIENKQSLLVILQGMDASGKDGAIKKVFTGVNPQHCRVVSFKEPDREEREHDYPWLLRSRLTSDRARSPTWSACGSRTIS